MLTQLNALNGEISATENQLKDLQAQLTALDLQVTNAQTELSKLQARKGANKDAIAAQKKIVVDLQDRLGNVQNEIRAIDGQIALGGCVA